MNQTGTESPNESAVNQAVRAKLMDDEGARSGAVSHVESVVVAQVTADTTCMVRGSAARSATAVPTGRATRRSDSYVLTPEDL